LTMNLAPMHEMLSHNLLYSLELYINFK